MRRIALHGLDQVRDQVVALLELHVDIGEGLVDALAQRHQPVIGTEGKENEDDNDAENDPAGRHGETPEWDKKADNLNEIARVHQPPRGGYVFSLPQAVISSMTSLG